MLGKLETTNLYFLLKKIKQQQKNTLYLKYGRKYTMTVLDLLHIASIYECLICPSHIVNNEGFCDYYA